MDEARIAILDGRLEDVAAASRRMIEMGEQQGNAVFVRGRAGSSDEFPLLHLGRADEALAVHPNPYVPWLVQAGRATEAKDLFDQSFSDARARDATSGVVELYTLRLLEAAIALGEREAIAWLLPRLHQLADLPLLGHSHWTCPGRHLGEGSALLGHVKEARQYYHRALEACAKIRFRPEIALTRLHLAELLLEHYPDERAEALEHLDFTIGEFREMKMQLSLERALRHRGLLKA
jgi:hypothetical protein